MTVHSPATRLSEFQTAAFLQDLWPGGQLSSAIVPSNQSSSHASVLSPGMVLIKGFLSPMEQQQLVDTTRALGVGPGGFYRPSYGNRGYKVSFT